MMNNEFLTKILHDINYDVVKKFEKWRLEELGFVPLYVKENILYSLISQDGDKIPVIGHAKQVINSSSVEFVVVSPSVYASLSQAILKKAFSSNSPQKSDLTLASKPSVNSTAVKADLKPENNTNAQEPSSPKKKRIGEILVDKGLITEEQVQEALEAQKNLELPLGSTLVKMGYISVLQLRAALAEQSGIPVEDFVTEEHLSSLPEIPWLSDEFIKEKKVVPLSFDSKSLTIGMVDPFDKDTIKSIHEMTGIKPHIMMITSLDFENFLNKYLVAYKAKLQARPKGGKDSLASLTKKMDEAEQDQEVEATLWEKVQTEIDTIDSDTARYAYTIVTNAIDQRASDIHIEPRLDGYVARFRIDGTLVEIIKIPQSIEQSVISRFKVLAKMNIAEHRRAQDGNFSIKYNKRTYDLRINTLPIGAKEKVVIRILAPSARAEESYVKDIKIVGAFPDDIEKIKYLISAPNGMVLTSGPTGSGKTTTLYALLKTLNSPEVNISTIEDPIEIRLDGVNQSAVNPKAGITFAAFMRAILRQDPDVILVGEIRDIETLETAISAALTGHFVLSTIHTNSAAATVTRLTEMGAKDYLISSTLNGVLAQRLVKKLCNFCKEEYYPDEEELRKITHDPKRLEELKGKPFYRPVGCPACKETGYNGRLALLEVLVVTKEIKKLIAQKAHDIEIEEKAIEQGMRTLKEACILHILNGETSVNELVRVLGLAGD